MTKKKLNKGFLIADKPIHDIKIVGENVVIYEKNDGNEGYLAEVLENGETETSMLFLDGGLRGSLKQSKILNKEGTLLKTGMVIDIIPTGKKDLEEGFVYTYDIFS